MTDNNHPITPRLRLVDQWYDGDEYELAVTAARWGADQELEACCKLLELSDSNARDFLYSARRPKPPSLKEQAKLAAAVLRSPDETCSIAELQQHWHTICNALEQLND